MRTVDESSEAKEGHCEGIVRFRIDVVGRKEVREGR
jgi:hypothetical protein